MASSMQMLSMFCMIAAICSQTVLSDMSAASDDFQLAFLVMDEQCPMHSHSENFTEATLPATSFSATTKARQIKFRSAPQKQKTQEPRKIKVAKVSPKPVAEAPKPATKARQIKVKAPTKVQATTPQKTPFGGSVLLSTGRVTVEEVKNNLIMELKATFRKGADHSRINTWENVIQPLYSSLPKNAKGLEPGNASAPSSDSLKEWVPEYMLTAIEQMVGTKGITSQELAVLAATFEDLAHKEAIARLKDVYEYKKLPIETPISTSVAEEVVAAYMTVYTADLGHRMAKTVKGIMSMASFGLGLEEHTQRWLREIQSDVTGSHMLISGKEKELNFKTTAHIVEEVGERYGDFNDFECRTLKEVLVDHESQTKPGMLPLSDFYRTGMNQTYWNFNEKPDYLRVLGAIDDSGSEPHLIIPNYISSVANCVPVSSFYSVCCRSECEGMMGNLENQLKSSSATPSKIVKAAGSFSEAPLKLSRALVNLLEGIAATNKGLVPLHSKEFAHWMHHAFPRECPVPHDSVNHPMTPDEWLQEFGVDNTRASKEELSQHLDLPLSQTFEAPVAVQVPSPPERVSRPTLLIKHKPVSAMTHLKNALFMQAESYTVEELEQAGAMPWHPQECEHEEPLPCVENVEELEELMPWASHECAEELFTQTKAESVTEDVELMAHGPEQQPLTQKRSLRNKIIDSSADSRPKEAEGTDMLWEVYNEPAENYWEREDHASQQSDKAEKMEVPTVPPQLDFASISQPSSPTLLEALESSAHQFSALLFLAVFLTVVAGFQSVASKSRGDKMHSSYSKIHEAHQDELLRSAAVGCIWQQWSLGKTSHDIV